MWKKLELHITTLLLLATGVLAQGQSMTLEEVIREALESNYQIRIAELEEQVAENNNTPGNAGQLPSVGIEGNASSSWVTSTQVFYNDDIQEAENARNTSQDGGLIVNWTIFDGFRMFARKDKLEKLEELGEANTRYYVEQTVADLATVYYQLLQEDKRLEQYRKSLEISLSRYELEKKRLDIGSGSQLDLGQAKLDMEADSSRVLQQKSLLKGLQIKINELMGREDPDQAISPEDQLLLSDQTLPKKDLRDSAQKSNAKLTQAQIREMIEQQSLKIENGRRWPEVSLFGQYNYDRSASEVGFLRSNQQYGPLVGVNVRFDLYNGGQERTARQNAALNVKKSKAQKAQVEQEIDAAFLTAYENYSSSLDQLAMEKNKVQTAREILEIAKKQYEQGVIDHIEFRQIQLNALAAESDLIRARFITKQYEIDLKRISGTLMPWLLKEE